ncbi:MAG TPA: cytochrome c [Saprospiraceae bacterium]|nr:cytochrome c [Saprospiraceae bacterium]
MKWNSAIILLLASGFQSCQFSDHPYKEGKLVYLQQCSPCHGNTGEGFGKLYPNLSDTAYIRQHRNELACWIRHGIGMPASVRSTLRHSDMTMPGFKTLNAVDLSNVLNYINHELWKFSGEFSLQELENGLKSCP